MRALHRSPGLGAPLLAGLVLSGACDGRGALYGGGTLSLTLDGPTLAGSATVPGMDLDQVEYPTEMETCQDERPTAVGWYQRTGAGLRAPETWRGRQEIYELFACLDAEDLGGEEGTWIYLDVLASVDSTPTADRLVGAAVPVDSVILELRRGRWEPITGGSLASLAGITTGELTLALEERWEGACAGEALPLVWVEDGVEERVDLSLSWSFDDEPR